MSLFDELVNAVEDTETSESSKYVRLANLDGFLKVQVPRMLGATGEGVYSHFCPKEDSIFGTLNSHKRPDANLPFLKDTQGTFVFGIMLKIRSLKFKYIVRVGLPDANTMILGLSGHKTRHAIIMQGGDENSAPLLAFCKELHGLALEKLKTRTDDEEKTIDANRYVSLN